MIRRLIKWFIYLCLLLLAGVVALILSKDTLIRNLTERRILRQTGLYVRIDKMHVGFTEPVISMQGFKLYNRPEFGGGLLLNLNDLYLEYDPERLRSGELHLTLFRLDLEELNIIRSAAGRTNITDFIERAGTEGRAALSRRLPAKQLGFTGIDTLNLSLGRIRFIDLRDPRRNRESCFGVKNLEIKAIRNEGDLYGVAGIVLLRSGLVNWAQPAKNENTDSVGLLQMAWDWIWQPLRREFGGHAGTSTNRSDAKPLPPDPQKKVTGR